MQEEPSAAPVRPEHVAEQRPLDALLHRWLVEYNPLYLLSAAFVFGGLTLASREVAAGDSLWAHLGGAAIAEAYALALIGGAAFLVRLGRRRPAAMLGMLAVLFQGDLVLHVETSSFLGLPGKAASAVWLLLFFAKLALLGRALELRFSRSAVALAALGGLGLAVLPHVLRAVSVDTREALVTAWLFSLAVAAVWTTRNVMSAVAWDVRGRRCVHGAWSIWAVLALSHAFFWASTYHFNLGLILAVVPLVAARYARREALVWLAVSVALLIAWDLAPHQTWLVALMAAATLFLAASRARLERTRLERATPAAPPYRSYVPLHAAPVVVVEDLSASARPRFYVGTLAALYLASWSAGWAGGALPTHHLWLDAVFVIGCVAASRRWRRILLLSPLGPVLIHLAFQRGWVSEPTTALHWGATSIATGFALLFGSLAVSWHLTRVGDGINESTYSSPNGSRPGEE